MKKTRLIPIIIVAIMLLNCILPLMTVNAATNKTITLNSKLYSAIKKEFQSQSINAIYNDLERKITISQEEIYKVTSLNLSNCGISDLTGLDVFSNLKVLTLTGNGLNSESNLEVLNNLDLDELDLSTNNIESLDKITNLDSISNLKIQNQNFTQVEVITAPGEDTILKLPEIIKYAGKLNVDPDNGWFKVTNDYDSNCKLDIIYENMDVNQKEGVAKIKINTTTENPDYTVSMNQYLMKLEINIPVDETDIGGSRIALYYLVLDSNERAAIFNDENLYNAVKKQLTNGTNDVNEELRTYIYGENGETLYKKAYSEDLDYIDTGKFIGMFVFDIDTLINEIPSLKLESLQVEDLTGLEAFVGLETELNLYDNYIETIEKIVELQENKNTEEDLLQARFTKQAQGEKSSVKSALKNVLTAIDTLNTKKSAIKAAKTIISNAETAIATAEAAKNADDATEATIKAQDEIIAVQEKIIAEQNNLLKVGTVNEDGTTTPSLYDQGISAKKEVDSAIKALNIEMEELYNIYNKEYKATSILSLELNNLTVDEFNVIGNNEEGLATIKNLYDSIVNKIKTLEETDGLSEVEKNYIKRYLELTFKEDEEEIYNTKLAVPESWEDMEAKDLVPLYKNRIEALVKADIYSRLVNYLSTIATYNEYSNDELVSLSIEYLEEFMEENKNSFIEKVCSDKFPKDQLYYTGIYYELLYLIEDNYDSINYKANIESDYTLDDAAYKANDYANYDSYVNYNEQALTELLGLAGKYATLTSNEDPKGEIQTYITLPALRKINLEDNAIESLDGIQNLPKLEELNASHNQIIEFVTIDSSSEVEKSFANSMRILNLNYNYIDNIKPIEKLKYLEEFYIVENRLSKGFSLEEEDDYAFNIKSLSKLKIADFSGNEYSDISGLIEQYILLANDNKVSVGEYIKNNLDIRFYNQEISYDLGKIVVKDGDSPIKEIDLSEIAPIFAQIEEIDSERITFSSDGIYGTLKPNGKIGIMLSNKEGSGKAYLAIQTKNSYVADGQYSIADGTTCTITYEVAKASVNEVEEPKTENNVTEVELGKTIQFSATVDAENVEDTSVVWTIERYDDEGNVVTTESTTNIDENGLLTIDPNETATRIVVTARSNFDNSKFATAEVNVVKLKTTVEINENITQLEQTKQIEYTATVTTEAEEKDVSWEVEGNTSENTKFENNVLTIGEDEVPGTILTIKATSKYDENVSDSTTLEVIKLRQNVTITVTEDDTTAKAYPNSTKLYTAVVTDENGTAVLGLDLKWSVTGGKDSTMENGLLTIGENEAVGTELTIAVALETNDNYNAATSNSIVTTVESNKVAVKKPTEDNVVFEQTPGTTVSSFINGLVDGDYTVKVLDANGVEVASTSKLATGMTVKIGDNTEYTVVVLGDVNGDGEVNKPDSEIVRDHRAETQVLGGAKFEAADVNCDGVVNRIDSFMILCYRAEKISTFDEDAFKDSIE